MKNNTLWTSALLLLVFACGSKPEQESEPKAEYLTQFRSYTINREAPKKKLAELIEKVHIVKLEETDESLIGNVFNLKILNDMMVFPDTNEKALMFFNSKGEFLNRLKRPGDGPEEYSEIWGFWMSGDTVKIYDQDNSEILSYTQQGEFLDSEKLLYNAMHVYQQEDGYWLDISHRIQMDSVKAELVHLNRQFKNPEYYLPYENLMGFPILSSISSFNEVGNAFTYKQILSDTVFLIEPDTVRPLINLNFGDDYLWNSEELRKNGEKAMSMIQESGKVWIVNTWLGPRYIYFNYNTSFSDYFQMILDRETGEMLNLNTQKTPDEKMTLMINGWLGDQMLVGISSLDLADLLEDLDESQYTFEEGSSLSEIESSENPAMMFVTFKNSLN